MDTTQLALVFNTLSGPLITTITNVLKKKWPGLSGIWTMVVTSALGIIFASVIGLVGFTVFPDQSIWVTFLVGLGVNQTAAQGSYLLYKKLKKPPITPV